MMKELDRDIRNFFNISHALIRVCKHSQSIFICKKYEDNESEGYTYKDLSYK